MTPGLGFLWNNFLGHFNPLPGHSDSIVPGKRGVSGGRPQPPMETVPFVFAPHAREMYPNGAIETRRGRKLHPGDLVELGGTAFQVR